MAQMDNNGQARTGTDERRGPDQAPGEGGKAYEDRLAHFIRLLSDEDESSRWRAAEALARIGDPVAVGPLIDTLRDDDARVRRKAAWALGRIGDPSAIPALRRLYGMEKEETKEIIAEALDAIRKAAGMG
jgi:HEAT repeat protein